MLVLNILKMCFKTYLNHPINQKRRKKKPKGDHSFQKKRGRVRRGMIMITDSMGFFFVRLHLGIVKCEVCSVHGKISNTYFDVFSYHIVVYCVIFTVKYTICSV